MKRLVQNVLTLQPILPKTPHQANDIDHNDGASLIEGSINVEIAVAGFGFDGTKKRGKYRKPCPGCREDLKKAKGSIHMCDQMLFDGWSQTEESNLFLESQERPPTNTPIPGEIMSMSTKHNRELSISAKGLKRIRKEGGTDNADESISKCDLQPYHNKTMAPSPPKVLEEMNTFDAKKTRAPKAKLRVTDVSTKSLIAKEVDNRFCCCLFYCRVHCRDSLHLVYFRFACDSYHSMVGWQKEETTTDPRNADDGNLDSPIAAWSTNPHLHEVEAAVATVEQVNYGWFWSLP
jgi:hypothetical protein